MRIVNAGPGSAMECVRCLLDGGLIIYPTETVYGLGADATNEGAVKRIFDVKGRDSKKPVSIAVANIEQAKKLAEFDDTAEVLAIRFLPGPLTLVLKARVDLPWITSDSRRIGIRIPKSRFAHELLNKFERPIVATSANLSGAVEPRNFDEIDRRFYDSVEIIVNGGSTKYKKPSTVVEVLKGRTRILREGAIGRSEIEKVLHPIHGYD
jgi:L-threonylcarbamoyladenylate synthase